MVKASSSGSKKKGHHQPKKPLGSYFRFQQEKREEVARENPDLKATEVAKRLGAMWKELSDDEKQHYKTLAEEEFEEGRRARREERDHHGHHEDEDEHED